MTAGQVTSAHGAGLHVPFRIRVIVVTVIVTATAIVGVGVTGGLAPQAATTVAPATTTTIAVWLPSLRPVPGEFRLSPGNQQPLGIVVPLPRVTSEALDTRGFLLGPGNAQPQGFAR